jgi:hypothetical protein
MELTFESEKQPIGWIIVRRKLPCCLYLRRRLAIAPSCNHVFQPTQANTRM